MLGVLVKGTLDDGRGKTRVNLFRHKHEIESGRTSSVGMEIMGFDTRGEIVTSKVPGRKLSWEEIGKQSVCRLSPVICHAMRFNFLLTGQSDQLHRLGRPRALPADNSLWSAEQQSQLLLADGRCQQWLDWHEQVNLTHHHHP